MTGSTGLWGETVHLELKVADHAAGEQRVGVAPSPGSDDRASGRTRHVLGLTCVAVVLARLGHAWLPLRSDEGGYLLVARHWAPGPGEFLYGDYHVDRPPLLLAFFRGAAAWDTDAAIRLIAVPVVVVTVLAVAGSGRLIGGHLAARWSAVVAGALLCSPALASDQADGELFAVAFVAASVLMALRAWRAATLPAALAYAFAAGLLAASATLVKQSFLDGMVFLGVVLLAGTGRPGRTLRACGAALAGMASAYVLAGAWLASWGVDVSRTWSELVVFRGDALQAIFESSLRAPVQRAALLFVLAVASAMIPIAWLWARWLRRRPGSVTTVQWATAAMLGWGVLGVALGGSYWPHYLLQLVPGVALAAGAVIADGGRAARAMQWLARASVASAAVATAVMVTFYALVPSGSAPQHVGAWLAESAQRSDTAVVAYGNPHVLEQADLASPYPYLWSLQMRTLDPQQRRLHQTLRGPDAPTWVVRLLPLDSWAIDRDGALRQLLARRYRHVASVCGIPVLLRVGVERDLAEVPDCGSGRPWSW